MIEITAVELDDACGLLEGLRKAWLPNTATVRLKNSTTAEIHFRHGGNIQAWFDEDARVQYRQDCDYCNESFESHNWHEYTCQECTEILERECG